MTIIQDLTTRNFKPLKNKKNEYIVIHYVGAVSSAKANATYFKNTYRGASAQYFVDDNEIRQVVRDEDVAWHVGAAYYKHLSCRNTNSIGIEMCCYKNKDGKLAISDTVVKKTIELTKMLMQKYNIPISHVLRHYDVTGKNCPAPFVESPSLWSVFLNAVSSQSVSKYKQGQRVLVNIPVTIAYKPSDNPQDNSIVDSNGYQFWISNSVIKDNKVYGLGDICFVGDNDLYIVQIFDKQFWCKAEYLSDKF